MSHEDCGSVRPETPADPSTDVRLEISGERIRRRTRVSVRGRELLLTNGCLRVLLHLMVAYGEGKGVHKTDLGARADQGFKGISLLREALKGALPEGIDIIRNDYHGNYTLAENVVVGDCDTGSLHAVGDRTISDLADELAMQTRRRNL